jgi:hypothetical protein
VVEDQPRIRNPVALRDLEAAGPLGRARLPLDGDAEALGDVGEDRVGVRVECRRLLCRVAVLEGVGAVAEERIVGLRVGGRDDQQVVFEPERRADVALFGRGGVDVHH